jgi:hypothetical protein
MQRLLQRRMQRLLRKFGALPHARGQVVALCLLMHLVTPPGSLLWPSAHPRMLRGHEEASRAMGQGIRRGEAGAHRRLHSLVSAGGLHFQPDESEPSTGCSPCGCRRTRRGPATCTGASPSIAGCCRTKAAGHSAGVTTCKTCNDRDSIYAHAPQIISRSRPPPVAGWRPLALPCEVVCGAATSRARPAIPRPRRGTVGTMWRLFVVL